MRMYRNSLLTILAILLFRKLNGDLLIDNNSCTHSIHCGKGKFCSEGICRTSFCTSNNQCEKNEECRLGIVNGHRKNGCFKRKSSMIEDDQYCIGGALVTTSSGLLIDCDLSKECPSTYICNPKIGKCCSKLSSTCSNNRKTLLNVFTDKPIICQFKNGKMLPCPNNAQCEITTGFCCLSTNDELDVEFPIVNINSSKKQTKRTKPGQICSLAEGCTDDAACVCDSFQVCKCECARELGFTISANGESCQRIKRRLKEKCKTDMECSAAFSECSSSGCRCKKGFKRNGDGGCEPIEYHCANNGLPLKKGDQIVSCSMKITAAHLDSTQNRDDCPVNNYCVPIFDDASHAGFYKGFCCTLPNKIIPTCPVGEAHESSSPPGYGCSNCPMTYYCHRDLIATEKEICCPKPCLSLDDIYHNGQCYSTSNYGESCHISIQCANTKSEFNSERGVEKYAEVGKMECTSGICSCPPGFSYTDGQCKRITCTIGLRGEPSIDKQGNLMRCKTSADCSMGHLCDHNTQVCCKGSNKCPKDYVETGKLCDDSIKNNNCNGIGELCHRMKNGKTKICCTYDAAEIMMRDEENSTIRF